MGEQHQIRSRSWNRMPTKRCSANGIRNEFIIVDDDEVIILDSPQYSKGKATGTSRAGNNSVLQRVISIDDDDERGKNVYKGGSGSRSRNSFAAKNLQTSAEVDNDECQFIQEKCAAFRFSRCNQTYSTVPSSSGTRYGLGSDDECDFSESDGSDCELFEGSHREVREQWEKAFLRKMKKAGKAGLIEEVGPSEPHRNTNSRPAFESRTEQHDQTSSVFPARNPDIRKESSSTFFGTEKSGQADVKTGLREDAGLSDLHCDTNSRPGFESRTEQHDQASSFFPARNPNVGKESSSTFFRTEKSGKSGSRTGLSEEAGPSDLHRDSNSRSGFKSRTEQYDQTSSFFPARNPDIGKESASTFFGTEKSGQAGLRTGLREGAGVPNLHCDANSRPGFENRTEQHDQTSSVFPARNPDAGKETSSTFFGPDNRNPNKSSFGSEEGEDNCANPSFCNKEDFPRPSSLSPEILVEHERFESPSTRFTSSNEPIRQNSFKEVEKQPDSVQVPRETSPSHKENRKRKAAYQSYINEVEEDASKSYPPQSSDGDGETTPVLVPQSNGASCEHGISSLGESRELIIDPIPSASGQVKDLHGTAPAIDVMLNREKLKETDEYKKAQEEEWESRQRQLQIQAEEAQRQRKRKKLVITRQLEMERRQKERVEEVRETQKKDEESMNMKDKVRAEITKSLKILELKSFNMASLLRGLGIHVGGGTSPPPNEVHAAYKRAVLKFHPDRASRGGIKQQVEAEEKFKLIARMKDKFLS